MSDRAVDKYHHHKRNSDKESEIKVNINRKKLGWVHFVSQRSQPSKGKDNKPNASAALSEEDIQVLYEKDLFGSSTAEAVLNTVWFNNTIHFGLRGCKEHREMCWGDVKLYQTSTGQVFLEFNERETKPRSGNDPRNVRAIMIVCRTIPVLP